MPGPSTPLGAIVSELIAEGGPLTFAAFQDLALYHPEHGYYASGPERSGPGGHFVTSPELDPSFGALWARALEDVWRDAGSPDFEVVEVGPGEGGFAAAVLDAVTGEFGDALTYRLVERLPVLTDRQIQRLAAHDNVVWSSDVDELEPGGAGVVFANEVLDNLPVHLVEGTPDGVAELFVTSGGRGLALEPGPPSTPELLERLSRFGIDLPHGHRFEIGLEAERFAGSCAGAVGRGAALFVDYGDTAAELAARPAGTLSAYSGERVDENLLDRPGERDLTSHANWDAVCDALRDEGCEVIGPSTQRAVLQALGLDHLHDGLRAEHSDAVAAGRGADAVRALSRRAALGVLADPGGLGGLGVVAGLKGIAAPAWLARAG